VPGRRSRLAGKAAVRLGVFVGAVAAQGQERGAVGHLRAFAAIQLPQERAAAIELAAGIVAPGVDAVIGHAAQHRMADVGGAAVPDVAAHGVATPRIGHQGDARSPGAALQLGNGLAEFAALLRGGGTVRLLHGVVAPRQRVGEIDRHQAVARHAVGFHAPELRHPERGVIAVAMHEQDRRHVGRGSGGGGSGLGRGLRGQRICRQRQRRCSQQDRSPRHHHATSRIVF
jgi:hypothetical protein